MKPSVVYVNRDSVVTNTEYVTKDSIITIPGDTIKVQIPCDKDTVYIVKSNHSSSLVQVKRGVVSVQNNCDEQKLIILNLQEKLHHYEMQSSDSVKTVVVKEKYVPVAYKVFSYGFFILLAAGVTLMLVNKNIWVVVASSVVSLVKSFKKN
jgi:hypothetical protein